MYDTSKVMACWISDHSSFLSRRNPLEDLHSSPARAAALGFYFTADESWTEVKNCLPYARHLLGIVTITGRIVYLFVQSCNNTYYVPSTVQVAREMSVIRQTCPYQPTV